MAVCLGTGAGVGLVNGLLVTRLRLPALISTLAIAVMVDGAAWVYTNGAPNGAMPDLLQFAANGRFGILPAADVIVALAFAAVLILLTRTVFGRRLYAVGANPRAAGLTGIRVEGVIVIAYLLCATLRRRRRPAPRRVHRRREAEGGRRLCAEFARRGADRRDEPLGRRRRLDRHHRSASRSSRC